MTKVVYEEISSFLEAAERVVDGHPFVARDPATVTTLSAAQFIYERSGACEIRVRVRRRTMMNGPDMRGRSSEVIGYGDSLEHAFEHFLANLEAWSGVLR